MTYYEELGLRPDATPEEIRQAYRNMVRLLHPDQQPDGRLRRLAEGQMKRLNAVHETLTDPVRRQQYDASLCQSLVVTRLAPREAGRRFSAGRDLGLVAVGIALASLFWQLSTAGSRRTEAQPPARPSPQPQARSAGKAGSREQRRRPAVPEPPVQTRGGGEEARAPASGAPAQPVTADSQAERAVEPRGRGPAPDIVPPALAAIQTPPIAPAARPPEDATLRYAGTWVYVRPRVSPAQGSLYPADYIEAVIFEDGGVLLGKYRARYSVPDRPISSEVAFRFEGKAGNDSASLKWSGAGGSEGELKLRLLSPNSMRVDWVATALGTQLGLASGTAVLIRRQER